MHTWTEKLEKQIALRLWFVWRAAVDEWNSYDVNSLRPPLPPYNVLSANTFFPIQNLFRMKYPFVQRGDVWERERERGEVQKPIEMYMHCTRRFFAVLINVVAAPCTNCSFATPRERPTAALPLAYSFEWPNREECMHKLNTMNMYFKSFSPNNDQQQEQHSAKLNIVYTITFTRLVTHRNLCLHSRRRLIAAHVLYTNPPFISGSGLSFHHAISRFEHIQSIRLDFTIPHAVQQWTLGSRVYLTREYIMFSHTLAWTATQFKRLYDLLTFVLGSSLWFRASRQHTNLVS